MEAADHKTKGRRLAKAPSTDQMEAEDTKVQRVTRSATAGTEKKAPADKKEKNDAKKQENGTGGEPKLTKKDTKKRTGDKKQDNDIQDEPTVKKVTKRKPKQENNAQEEEVVKKVTKKRTEKKEPDEQAEEMNGGEDISEAPQKPAPAKRAPKKKTEKKEPEIDEQAEENSEDDIAEKPQKEKAKKPAPAKRAPKKKTEKKEPEVDEHAEENSEDEFSEKPQKEKAPKPAPAKKTTKKKTSKDGSESPKPIKKTKRETKEEPSTSKSQDGKKLLNKTESDWDSIDFTCAKKNANGDSYNFKISTWNVGGLKAWTKKSCHEYLDYEKPDIFCMQETKANDGNIPAEIGELKEYKQYWCGSEKDGYAGVGLLTKKEPIKVTYGIDDEEMDQDGRCITAEFDEFYLVAVYVPNAGRKLVTLEKRLEWNEKFLDYCKALNAKKPIIICGDMNVSHNEIDLARPKNNTKNAGFTQEERDGMTEFLGEGFVDTWRNLYPDKKDMYTFWTYMNKARDNNLGWRLDYFIVSERMMPNVCDQVIRTDIFGSDHCPVTLFLNI